MNYYNEWDKGAAAWLRELIKAGHLPQGYVDERSIAEVTPGDLEGFTQCHFFAGIGGWPLALNMAGVRADQRLWTGSPPCQPFSVAGKQLGQLDERHLAPTFMRLVAQCRPAVLFGEQVAAAIGKHWLDDLFAELEKQDYACGAAVLPACSVGAPHKRDRLFFGANLLVHADDEPIPAARHGEGFAISGGSGTAPVGLANSHPGQRDEQNEKLCARRDAFNSSCAVRSMADSDDTGPQGRQRVSQRTDQQPAGSGGVAGGMGYTKSGRREGRPLRCGPWLSEGGNPQAGSADEPADPNHSFWSDADWIGC
ncbi:MAG: DNA cytosine methyltransferase, partial [Rhodanobacter sp.]